MNVLRRYVAPDVYEDMCKFSDAIMQFGGNLDHVVLGGASAGAQFIALHLLTFGETTTDLLVGVIAESQSFPTLLAILQAQLIYDALLECRYAQVPEGDRN